MKIRTVSDFQKELNRLIDAGHGDSEIFLAGYFCDDYELMKDIVLTVNDKDDLGEMYSLDTTLNIVFESEVS